MLRGKIVSHVPVVGQAYDLTKTCIKTTNFTNPAEAVTTIISGVIVDCLLRQVKYTVKCATLLGLIIDATPSGANPFAISLIFGQVKVIVQEELLEYA